MPQELLDAPSLLWVLNEAFFDKVSKLVAPLARNALHIIVYYRVEQILQILRPIMEWWVTLRQLKCEATKRPDVDLSRISASLGNFG